MKITHCKLKKKVQKELLRFFVLEVTARSAADILGIHPNSADCSTVKSARLSTIIWPWLPMRFLRALSSRTKAISADGVKADVVAVRRKSGCFGILKRNDGSIPLWWIMPSLKRYSLSSKRKSCRTVLFIPIV
ncbi:putative transposase [Neisseria meningitidis 2001073]|nr:putative transposase [Neisseria meningitidis 2001073]